MVIAQETKEWVFRFGLLHDQIFGSGLLVIHSFETSGRGFSRQHLDQEIQETQGDQKLVSLV